MYRVVFNANLKLGDLLWDALAFSLTESCYQQCQPEVVLFTRSSHGSAHILKNNQIAKAVM